jgi:hypothetical protein
VLTDACSAFLEAEQNSLAATYPKPPRATKQTKISTGTNQTKIPTGTKQTKISTGTNQTKIPTGTKQNKNHRRQQNNPKPEQEETIRPKGNERSKMTKVKK